MNHGGPTKIHRLNVRVFHWLNAISIVLMVLSGWQIYNATQFWSEDWAFPAWATLGDWLGGGIRWHLAAMWLLMANLAVYLVIGIFSGHFKRRFFPVTPKSVLSDFTKAATFKLPHDHVNYNSVQKASYIGVLLVIVLTILSGFEIWKPVQLQALGWFLGGYEGARRIHFIGMTLICAFIVMHLALVAIVPSTLIPMITGKWRGAKPSKTE
jgi:thiosulfate reductase cytochrome b subunit